MKKENLKKFKIPDKPGVYFFLKNTKILYIGKATSLKDRIKSYFSKDLIAIRGPMILDMTVQADNIKFQETDNVLEALILEAELIKKHQPKYNVKEKDDKSWNYVCITKEEWPKVLIERGRNLMQKEKIKKSNCAYKFGPYTNGTQLKEAMKIIRRIFPYLDNDAVKKNNKEFYNQLNLVPEINSKNALTEYKKNINNLKLFFQGKKKKIILNLKKEMNKHAEKFEFEKANEIKKQIFALEHINDIALIKSENTQENILSFSNYFRIEAYDIAHMSGKNMVGVMTVVENGQVAKNQYKKFIIRTQTNANDTGALEEVLARRLRHTEWGIPSLIVVDGSTAQINVAERVLLRYQMKIPVVSVVKDEKHKAKAIKSREKNIESLIKKHKKSILLANSEAHRFAISFYRQKSRKGMF
ncbi:MAG TPA: UvrB/UvrC motif-containing protein [Candidatus Paceibacterota bacterium]|nr:UvrB/UvrC motif-containing protein [Candidatus Paceibacterota bacterium]